MSSHANISDTPFEQRSPGHPEEGFLNCHRQANGQTDGHCGSMTESADSVKICLLVSQYYLYVLCPEVSSPQGTRVSRRGQIHKNGHLNIS